MAQLFPLLFDEGYLVWRAPFVVVRNYVAAQRRWDDDAPAPDADEPRTDHDATTTVQRSDHDGATTAPRSDHDGATKQELTPRNHESGDASARARAHSSVPSSSETTPEGPAAPSLAPAPPTRARTVASDVRGLFAHWQQAMKSPRSVLDAKRERLIRAALDRYGADECRRAVDGCALDPWSMGENDRHTKFNSIELILRDAAHVEKFANVAREAEERAARVAAEKARDVAAHEARERQGWLGVDPRFLAAVGGKS